MRKLILWVASVTILILGLQTTVVQAQTKEEAAAGKT